MAANNATVIIPPGIVNPTTPYAFLSREYADTVSTMVHISVGCLAVRHTPSRHSTTLTASLSDYYLGYAKSFRSRLQSNILSKVELEDAGVHYSEVSPQLRTAQPEQ